MRSRPVRSRIYLPETRLGVYTHDWPYVWCFVAVGFLVGKFLPIHVTSAELIGAILGLPIGMSFFTWTRVNRRQGWLTHTIRAALSPRRFRRFYASDRPEQGWVKISKEKRG